MRSDQRRQQFPSFQRPEEDDEEEEIFETVQRLLIKYSGVRWTSMYYMLRRALELKDTIERFHRSQAPSLSAERESGYSFADGKIRSEDWDEVLQYLILLRPFVEATMHLQGNADDREFAGTRGALWEVFVWMDVIGNNIDQALIDAADRAAPSEDSENGETSYFQDSLLLGKEKLEVYYLKMTEDTPYYYAAVILHPNMKLGRFKQH